MVRNTSPGSIRYIVADEATTLPELDASLSVSCPDVRTTADLDRIARDFCGFATLRVAVGARGLAESLAKALAPQGCAGPVRAAEPPICFVVGTNDPVTAAQLEHLRHARRDLLELDFSTRPPLSPRASCLVLRLSATSAADFVRQLPAFVRWAHAMAVQVEARTLVVSGGDTLRAFSDAAGWTVLVPLRSLGDGLVLAAPAEGGGPLVVSKSGGFGQRSAFSGLAALIHPDCN
jgi:D-threonate/D-erythronate kinase